MDFHRQGGTCKVSQGCVEVLSQASRPRGMGLIVGCRKQRMCLKPPLFPAHAWHGVTIGASF